MKQFIIIIAFLFSAPFTLYANPKNIVVFLVDDLGWSDLGIQGSTFYETPNIDAFARSGVLFTDAYSAHPVCTPSRSAILSGKNPGRSHITNYTGGAADGVPYTSYMPLEETTIAEVLKENGYVTSFFGKWHLGTAQDRWPEFQGFDDNFGGTNAGQPPSYFSPYNNPRLNDGPVGEYLTDRLTNEAVQWIQEHQDTTFFLYFSFYTVHTPIQAKSETISYYNTKLNETAPCDPEWMDEIRGARLKNCDDEPPFASMVHHLDSNVGRVLNELDQLGLDSNTIVIFTSDNGGVSYWNNTSSNLPLRGAKGWLYEGGIRVPFFVRWPGVSTEGSVVNTPVVGTDLFPTLLEMVGLPLNPTQHSDARSLVPLLNGEDTSSFRQEELVFHFPHFHHGNPGTLPGSAIRFGDYKLIEVFGGTSEGDNITYPYSIELYNLRNDIGEKNNLLNTEPEIANLLLWKLHRWRDSVNANMPSNLVFTNPPTEPQILGCTNPNADNYNFYATVDDNSCQVSPVITKKSFDWKIEIHQSTTKLNLKCTDDTSFKLRVLDVKGNTVFREDDIHHQVEIPILKLKKGLYFLQVIGFYNNFKTFKLVI